MTVVYICPIFLDKRHVNRRIGCCYIRAYSHAICIFWPSDNDFSSMASGDMPTQRSLVIFTQLSVGVLNALFLNGVSKTH